MFFIAGHDDSFTSNSLELTRVQRGPGLNDVGMVAWHMTLKTPECQQGRQVGVLRSSSGALRMHLVGWSCHLILICRAWLGGGEWPLL